MGPKKITDADLVLFVLNHEWGEMKREAAERDIIEASTWKIVYMDEYEFTLMGDYEDFLRLYRESQ